MNRCDLGLLPRRRTVWSRSASPLTTSLSTASALIMMAAASAANAACSPPPADGVTSTCTGSSPTYGSGAETGVTVNVMAGATIGGNGIDVHDGTVNNGTGASIEGISTGIRTVGDSNVTNSGSITGSDGGSIGISSSSGSTVVINNSGASVTGGSIAVFANNNVTVTNNAGAVMTGGGYGIRAFGGTANVTNSGSISDDNLSGSVAILAGTDATVINNANAVIAGGTYAIQANGAANVTNSGSIGVSDTSGSVISATTSATVINTTGASITGGLRGIDVGGTADVTNAGSISASDFAIVAVTGAAKVTNSGSITATDATGTAIFGSTIATVTNTTGGVITGGSYGIRADGAVNVTNFGNISSVGSGTGSFDSFAIAAGNGATVINNAGASITGVLRGIDVVTGDAQVTNAGSISGGTGGIIARAGDANVVNSGSISGTSTGGFGIYGGANATLTNNSGGSVRGEFAGLETVSGNATVTNNAGATISGGLYGVLTGGAVNVTNSGTITSTFAGGVVATTNATVINNAGGSITGVGGLLGSVDLTNSGSITGAGTTGNGVSAGTSATVTNNLGSSITATGFGIIAGAGGSSVFNAGTITGGTAAIQFAGTGNTLTLATSSIISGNVLGAGNDTLQIVGTGTASLDAGHYKGFGTLNKMDSSVWTLNGTGTIAGPVNVNAGTLSVNGDISSAASLTVNAGGTLGGNGTVGNTAIDGGTLAPGNSIGLLTVSGSLTLTAASSYLVEVSPANADRVNVTGAATLGGATVYASFAPGSYVTKQYTILHADGGVNGTFSGPVNTNLPSINASLSYDTVNNNVYLGVAIAFATPGGLNVNQQNVANALINSFNSNGGIPAAYAALTAAGLTQASGEVAIGSQQTTFDAMNLFLGLLTDPFVAGRGAPVGGGASASPFAAGDNENALAYAAGRKRSASERDAYATIYRKAPLAQVYEPRWSVWAAGFGGTQTTDGNGTLGSNTATSRIAAAAVGADYWFSPYTVAGFALSGGGTSFSVANSGTGRSDLFQAGAFVRHNVGPAYVTAALAYGWQDITTDRTVTLSGADHLQARFNANTYSGRLESGYRFVAPWTGGVGLTPYVAGQFTTFDLPAYAEQALVGTNAFALNYASKSVTASRTELGLRADKSFALNDAILTLRSRAAWAHDFNPDRSIAATFQALPDASFVVNGAAHAHDAALTSVSAEVKYANGLSFAAIFEGEFSDVTRSYAGKGVVRYAW